MFHSLLLLYSLLVLLFFLPLLGFLLRPAFKEFLRGVKTLFILPVIAIRQGRNGASQFYQQHIKLNARQFMLLVLVLFANLCVIVVGFGGFTAQAFTIVAGLFGVGAALCVTHVVFGSGKFLESSAH